MSQEAKTGRRFRLIESEGWVGGVCAGIGYYLGIPTWIIRLALFLIVMGTGVGVNPVPASVVLRT